MKSILLPLLLMAAVGMQVSVHSNADAQTKPAARPSAVEAPKSATPHVATATIDLPTIKCGMCSKTIKRSVKAVDGVSDVKVTLKTKQAEVVYDPSATNVKAIETAISEAGYNANKTVRNAKAYDGLHECCK